MFGSGGRSARSAASNEYSRPRTTSACLGSAPPGALSASMAERTACRAPSVSATRARSSSSGADSRIAYSLWADIQRRADDLAQRLYAMRESAPDEDERARVADTLGALQAVRSAMDAERAPGGADPRQAEVVRGRLYAFDAALRALRPPDPTTRY